MDKKPRLCVECRHHRLSGTPQEHRCFAPSYRTSLVTGETKNCNVYGRLCEYERGGPDTLRGGHCGASGKLWEPIEK